MIRPLRWVSPVRLRTQLATCNRQLELWHPDALGARKSRNNNNNALVVRLITYAPLKTPTSIRTIKILPKLQDDEDTIRCTFVEIDLQELASQPAGRDRLALTGLASSRRYVAISYVWGDQSSPRTILIDEQPFQIGRSLHSALVRVRRMLAKRGPSDSLLWADAICINQADLVEREQQVRLMGIVYILAELVVADLGEAPPGAEEDFAASCAFLEQVKQKIVDTRPARSPAPAPGELPRFYEIQPTEYPTLEDSGLLQPPTTNMFMGLSQVVTSNGYFNRAWIVQEFTLARQLAVLFGESVLSMTALEDAAWFLSHYASNASLMRICERGGGHTTKADRNLFTARHLPADPWESRQQVSELGKERLEWALSTLSAVTMVMTLAYQRNSSFSASSLLRRLDDFQDSLASDPRDKIYSLVNLSAGFERYLPHINYSNSVKEVYHTFAKLFVEQGESLELLYQVDSANTQKLQLPSWVPNWADMHDDALIRIHYYPGYCAGDDASPAAARLENNGDSLVLHGAILDTVKGMTAAPKVYSQQAPQRFGIEDFLEHGLLLARASSSLGKSPYYHPTSEPTTLAFFRTVFNERDHGKQGREENERLWKGFQAFIDRIDKARSAHSSRVFGMAVWKRYLGLSPWAGSYRWYNRTAEFVRGLLSSEAERVAREDVKFLIGRLQLKPGLNRLVFCVTAGGYFGVVPEAVREGDRVVMVYGSKVPFILRPLPARDGKTVYKFVGQGYFRGMMYGELFEYGILDPLEITLV